jgi:hypothetical protein
MLVTFLVLDLGLEGGDGVAALDLERDRLPRQRLHEDLHLAVVGVWVLDWTGSGGGVDSAAEATAFI